MAVCHVPGTVFLNAFMFTHTVIYGKIVLLFHLYGPENRLKAIDLFEIMWLVRSTPGFEATSKDSSFCDT